MISRPNILKACVRSMTRCASGRAAFVGVMFLAGHRGPEGDEAVTDPDAHASQRVAALRSTPAGDGATGPGGADAGVDVIQPCLDQGLEWIHRISAGEDGSIGRLGGSGCHVHLSPV